VGPESDQIRDPQGIGAQPFASAGIIPVGPESDQIRDPQGIGVQSFAPQLSEPTTSATNNSRTYATDAAVTTWFYQSSTSMGGVAPVACWRLPL
jgi:hypothetical protein